MPRKTVEEEPVLDGVVPASMRPRPDAAENLAPDPDRPQPTTPLQ